MRLYILLVLLKLRDVDLINMFDDNDDANKIYPFNVLIFLHIPFFITPNLILESQKLLLRIYTYIYVCAKIASHFYLDIYMLCTPVFFYIITVYEFAFIFPC